MKKVLDFLDDWSYIVAVRDKEAKKIQIIQKSSLLMLRKGYNGTGLQEIVDAAGIPKGSFYNYFDSKEHFAIEALNYHAENQYNRLKHVLTDKSIPPLQRIERFFSDMINECIHKWKFTVGCFAGNLSQEMGDISIPISKAADKVLERYKEPTIQCLREAKEAGDISPHRDVEKLAEFIWNSWEGALLRMKVSKSAKSLHAFRDTLFEILLR